MADAQSMTTQEGGDVVPKQLLPVERRAVVQSGLEEFQAALHERARFKEERDELRVRLAASETERDNLRTQLTEVERTFSSHFQSIRDNYDHQLNDAHSRSRSLEAERDQAVAERAFLESVLQLVKGAIDKAELPAPLGSRLRKQRATEAALNQDGGMK